MLVCTDNNVKYCSWKAELFLMRQCRLAFAFFNLYGRFDISLRNKVTYENSSGKTNFEFRLLAKLFNLTAARSHLIYRWHRVHSLTTLFWNSMTGDTRECIDGSIRTRGTCCVRGRLISGT
ncbi:hypothetical protein TcasGA2_TC001514 [Tribolium castaneum]|uniref:Uncharacterized protein n=1 Tax=Tribolium castaneum TaxID=7070 RepID=D7EI62_TRICA|nr:hypothetical protein TcasGA2_TC001514 [Tribolium castaneum]